MPRGTKSLYEYASEILKRLQHNTETYSQLLHILNLPSSTLSKTLKQLKKEGLIETILLNDEIHYQTNPDNELNLILKKLNAFNLYAAKENISKNAPMLIVFSPETASALLQIFISHSIDNENIITYSIIRKFLIDSDYSPIGESTDQHSKLNNSETFIAYGASRLLKDSLQEKEPTSATDIEFEKLKDNVKFKQQYR